jgi:hypothetical protein
MDAIFERNYRQALSERLHDALERVQRGEAEALTRLEDALASIQAQRFGIPKSSITRLWTLEHRSGTRHAPLNASARLAPGLARLQAR